jgi:hypothetical protein
MKNCMDAEYCTSEIYDNRFKCINNTKKRLFSKTRKFMFSAVDNTHDKEHGN